MYNNNERQILLPHDFFLPFGGALSSENRWVKLAQEIPWWEFEEAYMKNFKSNKGQKAYSVRIALGALIIQNRFTFSDEETVNQISENPYLQYFLGYKGYDEKNTFDSSLMVHFRKRFSVDIINQVNELIVLRVLKKKDECKKKDKNSETNRNENKDSIEKSDEDDSIDTQKNKGKLILDATCTPADIAYPTDLKLLNTAREKLEKMIDILHKENVGITKKPRTYRKKARKEYLKVAKQKRSGHEKIQEAIKMQLSFVKRNIKVIDKMLIKTNKSILLKKQQDDIKVIRNIYKQQLYMYTNHVHQVDNRIVSISQPHVRPIVRGKATANVEFGAKLSISLVEGFTFIEELKWDSYNEGTTLIDSIDRYHTRFGYYPEAVLADTIYRTRGNLKFCKEHNIRLSGPKLGRPPKEKDLKARKIAYEDSVERIAVEGKFGEGKRLHGLGLITTRLKETSETSIGMQILMMNLKKILRDLFEQFFKMLKKSNKTKNLWEFSVLLFVR